MKAPSLFFACLEAVIVVCAFIFSFWPLIAVSIMLAILRGDWIVALCVAVLADVLFGAPTGLLRFIHVPFTLGTLVAIVLWMSIARRMRSDMPDVL